MKKIRTTIIMAAAAVVLLIISAAVVNFSNSGLLMWGRNEIVNESDMPEVSTPGFSGKLIDSVSPKATVEVSPGEKLRIIVVAYSKADIVVRVGAKRYKARPADKEKECYTAFTASVTIPETYMEIDSLGSVTVIASYKGTSVQTPGPEIVAAPEVETTEKTQQTTTAALIENYVPSLPDDAYSHTTLPSVTQSTTAPATVPATHQPIMENQLCIVTKDFADTWPLIAGDDTYVPYFAPLPYGTIDYVTAASEAYNEDDDEQVYFYELASGRKVKRDAVQLFQQQPLPANNISVVSSAGYGGTLTIKLRTDWKVPYGFTYAPQNYYSAYGKIYNVTSFTASQLQLTFYHTASVTGEVDATGSNVISSAYWTSGSNTVTLNMPLKTAGRYYGYSAEYDENGILTITIHNRPSSVAGSLILLDPGHGGKDPGALGFDGAVYESNVNYALAYYTKAYLEQKGAVVYMTRGGDTTVELEQRKAMARSLKPDVFVSIHCNASENKSKVGTAVYYYKPFSFGLANSIYNNLLSVFKTNLYPGQGSIYSDLADGTMYYPFSVARLEDCPSVLVETGYMSNDSECLKLIDTANQQALAWAIATGIEQALIS